MEVVNKMTIRAANEPEVDRVVAIYEDEGSAREAIEVKPTLEEEFPDILTGKRLIFFAEQEGRIVGTVQLILDCNHKEEANGIDIAQIHHLKVHNNFCNKEYGELLVKYVENVAKSRGIKRITVGVDENNPHAKHLYEKWGYGVFKIEPGRIEGMKLFLLSKEI